MDVTLAGVFCLAQAQGPHVHSYRLKGECRYIRQITTAQVIYVMYLTLLLSW